MIDLLEVFDTVVVVHMNFELVLFFGSVPTLATHEHGQVVVLFSEEPLLSSFLQLLSTFNNKTLP